MAELQWYGKAYNCPEDPSKNHERGWYYGGEYTGITDYKNPATGKAYTISDFSGGTSGGGSTPTPSGTSGGYTGGGVSAPAAGGFGGYPAEAIEESTIANMTPEIYMDRYGGTAEEAQAAIDAAKGWSTRYEFTPSMPGQPEEGQTPGEGEMPTWEGMESQVPAPEVTPAPAYEPSPQELEMQELVGGEIQDWVKEGGYGIPEETQQQMMQTHFDVLKSQEKENIRVMRNNMERRGITNSGFMLANEQQIRANTTQQLAQGVRDIQIQSAFMKMASFERAMGQASQYLGYLQNQSQLEYAPELATWHAEQQAKLQKWQGTMDLYKMEIAQAYKQQNIQLTASLQKDYAATQHEYNLQLAQMEIETQQNIAQAQGQGQMFGSTLGFLGTIATGTL